MQKRALTALLLVAATATPALADDRVDFTTTWFNERRIDAGSLTVLHPQLDLGLDLGESVSLGAGYEADIVTGATEALYAAPQPGVDLVSSATTFSDTRHSGSGALAFEGRRSRLGFAYVYGQERDYKSHAITAFGSIDLPGKNTTLSLSFTHNFDSVCDKNNGERTPLERQALSGADPCFLADDGAIDPATVTRDLRIDTTEATLTQNVSPRLVIQFGLWGQVLSGFQSNPYRRVRVAGVDAQESHPLVRARLSLFARANLAFPGPHSSLSVLVRGYDDTWSVESLTLEMAYNQYLGKSLIFRLRSRVYQQDEAVFFVDAIDYMNFGSVGAYFSGDRELSPYRQVLVGGKLAYVKIGESGHDVWGAFDEVDFHIRADGMWAQSLTETAPGGDPGGPMPDMIVVSVGLLLRY